MESVEATLKRYGTDVFFRVDAKLYKKTKMIYDGDHFATTDADLAELLYARAVFEYNGER